MKQFMLKRNLALVLAKLDKSQPSTNHLSAYLLMSVKANSVKTCDSHLSPILIQAKG